MDQSTMAVFTGNANPVLAQEIARHLMQPLGRAVVGRFSDGEIQVWIDWLEKDGLFKAGQIKARDVYTNEFNFYRPGKTAEAR